ncbi:MAG: Membrane protein involved in aromatic hydrocarbon degradation [Pedosphaera sp.]|nr:Membrane protein involved in aromatic hydrocarbon degradation [Pedosphaera sp.]
MVLAAFDLMPPRHQNKIAPMNPTAIRKSYLPNALLFGVAILHPFSAHALGFRIPNQDAEAIGRGDAFAATADNPSAIYYNPAGITQLEGQNLQFGVHALSANSHYEAPNGNTAHTKFAVQPVPELYYTQTLKDYPISFGLGIFIPYGLALKWPEDSGFRTKAIEGSLTYVTINPVVAWKVCDELSLAAGPTIDYSQVMLRQGLFSPVPGGDEFRFKGSGTDFGFTCGIMWQPFEMWSFGGKYHSATSVNYEGTASTEGLGLGNSHSTARLPFAQFAAAGISFRPTKKWNFEADVDWTDWDSMGTVTFKDTPLGNVPLPLNWKSSYLLEFGVTRYLENGYFVSGGNFFSQNSTSENDFNPVLPDTDLHVGSLGFGHKGERWAWTIAAQFITGPDRTVATSTPSLIGESANGKYHWMNASLDFSVRYHF